MKTRTVGGVEGGGIDIDDYDDDYDDDGFFMGRLGQWRQGHGYGSVERNLTTSFYGSLCSIFDFFVFVICAGDCTYLFTGRCHSESRS